MYSADAALKVAHHQFCVLYDPTDGRIVCTYESITLEGAGPAPQPADLEARARTQSSRLVQSSSKRPVDYTNLKSIMIGPEAFATPGRKKVDLQRRTIVPAED
jgi:hypothetical protein